MSILKMQKYNQAFLSGTKRRISFKPYTIHWIPRIVLKTGTIESCVFKLALTPDIFNNNQDETVDINHPPPLVLAVGSPNQFRYHPDISEKTI